MLTKTLTSLSSYNDVYCTTYLFKVLKLVGYITLPSKACQLVTALFDANSWKHWTFMELELLFLHTIFASLLLKNIKLFIYLLSILFIV